MTHHATKPAIIITGSTGLIGSRLVQHFAGPYRVFALDIRPPEQQLPDNAEYREIDVTSDDRVKNAFSAIRRQHEGPVASVIQLAAYYDFTGEPSDLYEKITIQGTRRVLDAARELEVEQFIFPSTMLVHAPTVPGTPFNENQPLEAKWEYPQSKIAAENIISEHRGDVPTVLLRIAGVYTDRCDSLPLSHQIQRIHERRLTARAYPGDARSGHAMVHADDLVDAFGKTVENRRQLPREAFPILIGEPETAGFVDLRSELGRLLHDEPDWKTYEVSKSFAKTGAWLEEKIPGFDEPFIKPWMIDLADDHYELDITRAREKLGWNPSHRLLPTLETMIRHLRQDPAKWYQDHGLDVPDKVAAGND